MALPFRREQSTEREPTGFTEVDPLPAHKLQGGGRLPFRRRIISLLLVLAAV